MSLSPKNLSGTSTASLIKLPRVLDERGALTVVEAAKILPFDIKRVYYLSDIPNGSIRGAHAHLQLQQVLVAVAGSFQVELDNGVERKAFTLSSSEEGLYIPPMTWREIYGFTADAVCLVFASEGYEPEDYIREYDVFLERSASRSSMSFSSPPQIPESQPGAEYQALRVELDEAYQRVMRSGRFILGPEVEAFESEFADYCEVGHCISVGNGLEALVLSLRALGVGPGDEVIVPAHTFIATWLAVTAVGAVPVAVDIDRCSYTLDTSAIEAAITPRTAAIIPVHLYGLAAEMTDIDRIAARHHLHVVEDAAQAHGGRFAGKRIGSLGTAAAFSFYPVKNLGAFGDGGAITTDDAALAQSLRLLRNYGSTEKYVHESIGQNSRLDELQAAFLRVKLRSLDVWNEHRRSLARQYNSALQTVEGLTIPTLFSNRDHVYHQYVVSHPRRDALQSYLKRQGIPTAVHYPHLPYEARAYSSAAAWSGGAAPNAEHARNTVLSLPIGPHITSEYVSAVADACKRFDVPEYSEKRLSNESNSSGHL